MTLSSAQHSFRGSFLMSFRSSAESEKNPALLWNIQAGNDGGKMMLEIQDDMKKKGVSKRVIFNTSDSTWTMLLEFVNSKQGSRIHAASMFRDTTTLQKITMKKSTDRRTIDGYRCKKIILESDAYLAEAWLTNQFTFDLCYIYKLVSHCGLMGEFVRDGDWFNWKNARGMIIEVTSTKKKNGESYTMNISNVTTDPISEDLFSVKGFKISDIPDGQNCGAKEEEK